MADKSKEEVTCMFEAIKELINEREAQLLQEISMNLKGEQVECEEKIRSIDSFMLEIGTLKD